MKRFLGSMVPSVVCVLAAAFLVMGAGCERQDPTPLVLSFEEITSPAGPGSGEPNFFVSDDGRLYVSWIETASDGYTLKFSTREGDRWSEPRTIATGDNWFVNWADFPSVVADADGALSAHWLVKSGDDTYAYDIHIAHSQDGGKSWSDAFKPHTDGTKTEHGFVTMLPWSGDRVLLTWLDGRKFAAAAKSGEGDGDGPGGPGAELTLRAALMDREGRLYEERSLDERVCDCCQTSGVRTPNGAVFAYRDRSSNEIRDISIARFYKGEWQEPVTVFEDGWKIAGCPVNGPAVAAQKKRVAVAWFTIANETARVKVAFSKDEGKTFDPPVTVDDGDPLGRVDMVMLDDGSVLVSWMEFGDQGAADIRIRRIQPDGTSEPSMAVTQTSRERAAGFPQMARTGNKIYLAWTVPGDPPSIHTAVSSLGR
ncbi:MAG: sialidase family protein [Candidatus Krumholzibacteria bacterium]